MPKLIALLCALLSPFAYSQVEVKDLQPRPGVTLRIAYSKAATPVASAVLFQGGGGNLKIFANGSIANDTAFLSGGIKRFTDNNITVAIVDSPSDRHDLNGTFRSSQEHAEDAAAVIAFLRSESKLPVWGIGTSNGSLSAANASARLLARGPDGIVLTSSTTVQSVLPQYTHLVTEAKLADIKVPALWVHHKNDECKHTPYDAIPALVASMTQSQETELITVSGGDSSGRYGPCASGFHQFQGIENDVTKKIADWIKHYELKRNKPPSS
jgi:hypothetical protein